MRITFYGDLESAVPRKFDRCVIAYRYLQERRRNTGEQYLDKCALRQELSQVLDVSERTVDRMLSQGDGIFWSLLRSANGRPLVVLLGLGEVYTKFGVEPCYHRRFRVPVEKINGSISRYRQFLYAVALAVHTAGKPEEMTRAQVAGLLKVSKATTRSYEKDSPWVHVSRQYEPLGRVKGVFGETVRVVQAPVFPEDDGCCMIELSDGTMALVRQKKNVYVSLVAGMGTGKPVFPAFVGDPFVVLQDDELGTASLDPSVAFPADGGRWWFPEDREQEHWFGDEKDDGDAFFDPGEIVVPPGWVSPAEVASAPCHL